MPLKLSYKDGYHNDIFDITRDFIEHYIFRIKCWGCHFLNMEEIIVSVPYGICVAHQYKDICLLHLIKDINSDVVECATFQEQYDEEYIQLIQLANKYRILL